MLEVAPVEGVKVPVPALNDPPLPEVCVQVPPACSPVIKLYRLIGAVSFAQIVVEPLEPAKG